MVSLFLFFSLVINSYAGEVFRTESFSDTSFSEVIDLTISDDRQTAVFISSQIPGDITHIYAMDVDSGAVRNLSGALILDKGFVKNSIFLSALPLQFQPGYLLSPDSQNVAFFARASVLGDIGLYQSPLDGSTPPVRVSGTSAAGTNAISARYSNDGTKLAYLLELSGSSNTELNVVDSGGQPLGLMFEGSNMLNRVLLGQQIRMLEFYKFSADSSHLVYGDGEQLNSIELVNGATRNFLRGPAVDFFPSLIETERLFEIMPTSDRVVFLLEEDVDLGNSNQGESNLYSIPISGGTQIQLNDRQSSQENVLEFFVLEEPNKILFRSFSLAQSTGQVFAADADVAASAEVISDVIPANQTLTRLIASNVGSKAVFVTRVGDAASRAFSLWTYDSSSDNVTELTTTVQSTSWQPLDGDFNVNFPSDLSALWFIANNVPSTGADNDFRFYSVDLENILPPLLIGRVFGPGQIGESSSQRPEEYAITYIGDSYDDLQEIVFTDILTREHFQVPLPFGVSGELFGELFGEFSFFSTEVTGVVDNDTILFPYGDPDTFTMRFYISRRTEMDSDMCFPIAPPNKNPVVVCL